MDIASDNRELMRSFDEYDYITASTQIKKRKAQGDNKKKIEQPEGKNHVCFGTSLASQYLVLRHFLVH